MGSGIEDVRFGTRSRVDFLASGSGLPPAIWR